MDAREGLALQKSRHVFQGANLVLLQQKRVEARQRRREALLDRRAVDHRGRRLRVVLGLLAREAEEEVATHSVYIDGGGGHRKKKIRREHKLK